MRIELLKSKIHRVKITQAELHYVGSITVDEALMEAADIVENEKVQVGDVVIIIPHASIDKTEASRHQSILVFPNENNELTA